MSVAGDRVFAAGDIGDSDYLIALSRSDGKVLWKTKVGKSGSIGMPPWDGPRCTPTVGDKQVIAVSQFGEVLCADAATGKALWHKDCVKDFGGKTPLYGYCGMPLVDGDNVVLIPGGGQGDLVALNNKTGGWSGGARSSPMPSTTARRCWWKSAASARSSSSRTSVSRGSRPPTATSCGAARKGNMAMVPTPIYQDNMVYVSSGYGAGCNLFKIKADQGKFSAAKPTRIPS